MLREEVAQAGYTECLTSVLCSREDNFDNLRREDDGSAVGVANPKAKEFEVRPTLVLSFLPIALSKSTFALTYIVARTYFLAVGANNSPGWFAPCLATQPRPVVQGWHQGVSVC